MVVLIDNYDSFTYNIVQRIGELDRRLPVRVFRNDRVTVEELAELRPDYLIISPGPCTPTEAGISNESIRHFAGQVPILGVCLGHQCLAFAFGGKIVRADRLMHGKTSPVRHDGKGVLNGLANPFVATRYHSLVVERSTLPGEFVETAWTDQDELMGIRHKSLPLEGVQFHPESFLTDEGPRLLANFLAQ
ncbi:MAG: aminodeoxychorismate/anthranilate synthase component II [Phycisphaerales bacterium]|nr:MAG: aminodeoxychorismate/anthranilate synthase component II [Phycisphaerales bacterium]